MSLEDETHVSDFHLFDGNAQGFRVLTRIEGWRGKGGLRLSKAVLGAFSKYPFPSSIDKADKLKKFGYFRDDASNAENIYNDLGLIEQKEGGFCRHPLSFIVEAADDICYLTSDIDDAHRMKRIETDRAEELLKPIGSAGKRIPLIETLEVGKVDPQDKIKYLRAGAVSALIDAVIKAFVDNLDYIMNGNFNEEIIYSSNFPYVEETKEIKKECISKVYIEKRKLEIEQAGYNIITGLMDFYADMILDYISANSPEEMEKRNKGRWDMFSDEYRSNMKKGNSYASFLALVDYISGCTDRFALELHQKLNSTSITLGRMN